MLFVVLNFQIDMLSGWNDDNVSMLKVYLERILRKPEVDAFAEELKPHQVKIILSFVQMEIHLLHHPCI